SCGTAADPAKQDTERAGRNEKDVNLDFADVGGTGWPVRGAGRHVLDISPIRKSRWPIALVAGQPSCNQPAVSDYFQKRHAIRLVQRTEQVMYQAGDKHCLAGPAQTGDCETDGGAFGECGKIEHS